MRTVLIAAAVAVAGFAAGGAEAQVMTGGAGTANVYGQPGPGWGGGYIGGQWAAGSRAPGGWNAYRRPHRGWRMPNYWRSPDYRIQNFQLYGLAPPPQGYGWSRYYDDAVLVDYDGQVYDSVSGIDWRRVDQPYSTGYGYPSQGYWNAPGGHNNGFGYGYGYGAQGGQSYAGDGYAYAQGGQGGQVIYAPQQQYVQQGYSYGGGYIPGGTSTATVEFDMGQRAAPPPMQTTTTTTTTTEEWVSEPVETYVPVTERVIYKQGPTRYIKGPTRYVQGPTKVVYRQSPPKVIYRTVEKPVYRKPVKTYRPAKPVPRCYDPCSCGEPCS